MIRNRFCWAALGAACLMCVACGDDDGSGSSSGGSSSGGSSSGGSSSGGTGGCDGGQGGEGGDDACGNGSSSGGGGNGGGGGEGACGPLRGSCTNAEGNCEELSGFDDIVADSFPMTCQAEGNTFSELGCLETGGTFASGCQSMVMGTQGCSTIWVASFDNQAEQETFESQCAQAGSTVLMP